MYINVLSSYSIVGQIARFARACVEKRTTRNGMKNTAGIRRIGLSDTKDERSICYGEDPGVS